MGRDCHNGSCSVTGHNVFTNTYRYLFDFKRIYGIRPSEDHCNPVCFGHTFPFCFCLYIIKILPDLFFLFRNSQFFHPFTFRGQDHECNAENSVGPGGENGHGKSFRTVVHHKIHLGSLRSSDPVSLHFLERSDQAGPPVLQANVPAYATPSIATAIFFVHRIYPLTDRPSSLRRWRTVRKPHQLTDVSPVCYAVAHKNVFFFIVCE